LTPARGGGYNARVIVRWLGGSGLAYVVWLALATGCTTGGEMMRRDTGPRDAPARDTGSADDAGRSCNVDSECNDGIACTADTCGVGYVCRNQPLDELCPMGQRCVAGVGCAAGMPSTCETHDDCSDGAFCNGAERCVGPAGSRTCVRGEPVDCDDGNACTIDTCDEAVDGCTYEVASGCDAGVGGFDAGAPCDPFEPRHYNGTFTFRPAAVSACTSSGTYNISEITMSVSGGALSVRADRFTLTQSPAPSDGTFDVTFSDSCATFRLQGMFTCANTWMGTWTATFGGSICSFCTHQMMAVRGSRR
jgi:hypothetical protein